MAPGWGGTGSDELPSPLCNIFCPLSSPWELFTQHAVRKTAVHHLSAPGAAGPGRYLVTRSLYCLLGAPQCTRLWGQ